ncbi:MAG: sigma-70 family RNA polymerase sigma factor [Clostridia bacterium]|nr:sigma-70 family RNA polymerase sigma factor [Clostridia bacterium]
MQNVPGPETDLQVTFTQLVETYQKPLLNLCYMNLRDRTLAEDAVQEAFLRAYRALGKFRGECSEKTWLMRIAVNVCRDMQRSGWFTRLNRYITPDDLPEAASEEPDNTLADAIMRLPGKYREVVLLYYDQNMTMPEIAGALGIHASSVSRRLKTACEKLRDALGEEGQHG